LKTLKRLKNCRIFRLSLPGYGFGKEIQGKARSRLPVLGQPPPSSTQQPGELRQPGMPRLFPIFPILSGLKRLKRFKKTEGFFNYPFLGMDLVTKSKENPDLGFRDLASCPPPPPSSQAISDSQACQGFFNLFNSFKIEKIEKIEKIKKTEGFFNYPFLGMDLVRKFKEKLIPPPPPPPP